MSNPAQLRTVAGNPPSAMQVSSLTLLALVFLLAGGAD